MVKIKFDSACVYATLLLAPASGLTIKLGRALVFKLTGPEFEPFCGHFFSSITIILIIWKFFRVNACTTLPFFIVLNFLLLVKDELLFLIDINVQYTRKKLWQIYNIAGNYVLLH